jgi:hypothetical protein
VNDKQWGGLLLLACARSEGDGMARARRAVHGRAQIVRACTRGRRAQRGSNQQELAWRRRRRHFCPYVGGEEVSWTGGLVVAMQRTWACQRTMPT